MHKRRSWVDRSSARADRRRTWARVGGGVGQTTGEDDVGVCRQEEDVGEDEEGAGEEDAGRQEEELD